MKIKAISPGEIVEVEPDEEVLILTSWGCLSAVLADYNVDVSHITGRMGQHIVDDFMALMEKTGYVERKQVEDHDQS